MPLPQMGDDDHGNLVRAHLAGAGVKVLTEPAPGRDGAATPSAVAHLDPTGAAA